MNLKLEITKAICKYPEYAQKYRDGNTALIGLFVGEVMKSTNNLADPKETIDLLKKELHGKDN